MKKLISIIITMIIVLILASPVIASGDKVRGDKAVGPANQSQNSGLPYENRP
mgnify:CR=1 FL=1